MDREANSNDGGRSGGQGVLPGIAALTFAYVMSQFFRSALGVVAPEIATDLGLGPAGLGRLSAVWFVAFAAMQIPVGIALDRFGPRRTVGWLLLVSVIGCTAFTLAPGPGTAFVGQALIGAGCSPVFMGTLLLISRNFDLTRFARYSSLVLAVGNAGTLLGATPLALAAAALGWRGALLMVGGITLLAVLLVAAFVRDPPPVSAAATETIGEAMAGVREVMANRALWPILPLCFTSYAVVITLRGLWGGPYLTAVFEFSPVARGNALFAISLGIIAGVLLFGWLERRLDVRRAIIIPATCVTLVALAMLAALVDLSAALATALLALAAGSGVTYMLLMAQGRRFVPPHQIGRGLTLLNGAAFLGSAVIQSLSGSVLDWAERAGMPPIEAYRCLFLFLAAALALALAPYFLSRDRKAVL